MMKPWTISISYAVVGDDGKRFRAKSAIQVSAEDIPNAYKEAEKCELPEMKLGAILPGHHTLVP